MKRACWKNLFLQINLTTGNIEKIIIKEGVLKKFLVGRGIGDWLLFQHANPGKTDPLSPDNVLIFGSGILLGTGFPGAVRTSLVSLNVLTGGYGESSCGGHFATRLKKAGYDGIILQGRATNPVYLWIEDDRVEIRDASNMIDRTTFETSDMIKNEINQSDVSTCTIGPAGERLVRYALINCDNRYAGRCGMGAVMGSKNLKAIAVRGTGNVLPYDQERFKKIERRVRKILSADPSIQNRARYGLGKETEAYNEMGLLFVKNFQEGEFDRVSDIGYKEVQKYYKEILPCITDCPAYCDRYVHIPLGEPYGSTTVSALEATPAYNMAHLLIDDIRTVLKAFELCNGYGIDMHSWSTCMGWAIECFERKILTRKDTDNLSLRWGDGPLLLESIRRIAFREGYFGNLLAEGVARASKETGRGSEEYAMHLKGMEIDDELRVDKGMAFGILTDPRGPGHTLGAFFGGFDKNLTAHKAKMLYGTKNAVKANVYDDKADLVVLTERYGVIQDCLGICWFASHRAVPQLMEKYNVETLSELIETATGWKITGEEINEIAERVLTVERAINILSGQQREDEYPPKRFFEPIQKGPGRGMKLDRTSLDMLFERHSKLHGWDPRSGIPKGETLDKLGIGELAVKLQKEGLC